MRLWKKIILSLLALFVLVVSAGWVYLFPLHGLEKIVNSKLNSLLAKGTEFQVSIGSIGGDVINGLTLEDVVVTYGDSLDRFETVRARKVTLTYSISNLWHRELRFSLIQIDSLDIHVRQDSTGRFLPQFTTSKDTNTTTGEPPSFFIGTFLLNEGAITYARRDDTIAADHLSLEASFLIEEGTYAMDIQRLQMVMERPSAIVHEVGGKLTFANGNLYFENLKVRVDSTSVNLTGLVSPGQKVGSVEVTASNVNLADLKKFGGPSLRGIVDVSGLVGRDTSGVRGKVLLQGTFFQVDMNEIHADFRFRDKLLYLDSVSGTWFDSSQVSAKGMIDFSVKPEKYTASVNLGHFNLQRMVSKSFRSDLSGQVKLYGVGFNNRDLSLDLDVKIAESSFDEYPIQEASGKLNVTTDSIRFFDGFAVRYFENWLKASGKVDYSGLMDLMVEGNIPRLDRYTGRFFIKEPAGRGRFNGNIIGKTSDPSVRGTFTSDSLWLYELYSTGVSAELEIDHFFSSPSGDVRCRFDSGLAWDIPYDSIFSIMRIDSGHVMIDSLFSENAYSSISTRGNFWYDVYPSQLRLDTLRWTLFSQRFTNSGPVRVDIDSAGYAFVSSKITDGEGQFAIGGRVNYDESLAASIDLENAQLAPWIQLFRDDLPMTAIASCRVNLQGDLAHPAFVADGSLDSLTYEDLELGDMSFGVRYDDRKMTVDSVVVLSHPGVYRAEGSFYVDLALTQRPIERLPRLPMSLTVSMSDTVFNLVFLFLPSVEDLSGQFYAGFNLTGTPAEPHLNGKAWLKGGRLKYFDLRDTLFTDSAEITMEDNQIVFDRIEAYVYDFRKKGHKSFAILDGEIVVKSLDTLFYDIDVTLPREFPFRYELEDIIGVVEGELHIEGDNTPKVTGDLQLITMRYEAEFARAEEGSPLMQTLNSGDSWDLDINFDIPSNYWIKNSDVDAELWGAINLIRESGNYRFVGDMTFLRGRGFLFDKTFRIDAGSTVIFEDIEYLNPRLDITAWTRIPGQRRETDSVREDIDLCVRVTGTLEAPQIDPCEGSQFSQGDILPLIVANYYSSDTAQASGQFSQRTLDYLSRPLSQAGERGLRRLGKFIGVGVETFEIDPGYSGELDPLKSKYTLGLSPAEKLYVFGNYSAVKGGAVGFEYRFNKSFFLQGRRDENELYQLNLQLHWEL
jgi:hypothetical protein